MDHSDLHPILVPRIVYRQFICTCSFSYTCFILFCLYLGFGRCAFLADAKLTTEEVIKELAQIAGRPTEDEDEKEKVADEDDGECGTFCLRGNRHIKELFF